MLPFETNDLPQEDEEDIDPFAELEIGTKSAHQGNNNALAAFEGPVIELHLSNPNSRESWRHTSVVAPVATGSIIGLGGYGYELAVHALADALK